MMQIQSNMYDKTSRTDGILRPLKAGMAVVVLCDGDKERVE